MKDMKDLKVAYKITKKGRKVEMIRIINGATKVDYMMKIGSSWKKRIRRVKVLPPGSTKSCPAPMRDTP